VVSGARPADRDGREAPRTARYAASMPADPDAGDAVEPPAAPHPPPPHGVDPTRPREADWVVTTDIVFPHHANTMGTLFGGRALELLDINAAIACYRFARRAVVTASTEPIDFRAPVHVGEILEVRSRVVWTGRTSMIVRGELIGENPRTGERRLATIGHASFVALDADGHPTLVPPLRVETDEELHQFAIGIRVREHIQQRRADGG
jgi:acyl-CoA hydrolase